MERIEILNDTLETFRKGFYVLNGKRISLNFGNGELEEAEVFLPEDVDRIQAEKASQESSCDFDCVNEDSFSYAFSLYGKQDPFRKENEKVLVLNFANPVSPGGGVRFGAKAQEEDLCRRSSLLLSLEGEKASSFYKYNLNQDDELSSKAVLITPEVKVIKDKDGRFLEEPFSVAVMTCAAPIKPFDFKKISKADYERLFYERICGMLKTAFAKGYRNLVLGAWGCGAFGNDPALVSDLFSKALKEWNCFRLVHFAVLDNSPGKNNFREFSRNFGK